MFHPKKQLGQNFLKSDKIAQDIIAAAEIKPTDTIIEIGPGTGILTEKLVKTGAQIFAIEKDFDLLKKLEKRIGSAKNLKLIHQDALWFNLDTIPSNYKVVANIPYNITSPLIRKFIEGENKPSEMILMVQKEVAERICAKAGNSERGLLTLIVEYYCEAQILFEVSRREFYPQPKVDSAVVKINPYKPEDHFRRGLDKVKPDKFFRIVKAGFSQKRRQIHNSLSATYHLNKADTIELLKKAKIDPMDRAEDLTLDEWLKLSQNF